MKLTLRYFCLPVVLFAVFSIFNVSEANAATLYFSPSSGNFSVGNILATSVLVNTQSQAINNSGAVINFPAGLLEVISISKSGSIFSLWVEEPAFSNSAGTISFDGGLPTPGFNGTAGKIVNIVFRIRNAGTASLIFSSGAVRANDGYGTDVLQTRAQAQFNLISEERIVAPPPALGTPQAPIISSLMHPDQKKWYSKSTATFIWPVSEDVTATRILIGKIPDTEPTILYIPPISTKTVNNLEDGIWYFHAQLKNNSGWGATSSFKLQIDTKQPNRFDIQLTQRDDLTKQKVSFIFYAEDELSGIDHYEVRIDDRVDEIWKDNGKGVYTTKPMSPGKHILIAKAVDKAGNSITNSTEFTVESSPLFRFGFLAIDVLSLIIPLIALLVLLIILLLFGRRKYRDLKKRLHKEVRETEEALRRAFDLLRKDIKEQLKLLEKAKTNRQLTEEEDKIIKQLKRDLDRAENIIGKEVEDIEKEIK